MFMQSLARILVKHVGNAAGFGVGGQLALDIWDLWNKSNQDQRQKLDEIRQLAGQSSAEAHEHAVEVVAQEAAGLPEADRERLTAYLSQVPNAIQASQPAPGPERPHRVLPTAAATGDRPSYVTPADATFQTRRPSTGFGDWELEELLGTGGFGEVWKAKNPLMAERVALKFCLDKEAAKVLRHEAAVLSQVMGQGRHPGIVSLLDTSLNAEVPCLKYEFVGGGDLTSLVYRLLKRNQGELPVGTVTGIMRNIVRGVRYAHRLTPPIVHRDLKPANILVQPRPDGKIELRIADFGIGGVAAKCELAQGEQGEDSGSFLTTGARGSCTPLYASQQQMGGEDPDPRDDVHALGVIWYQLLVGDLTVRPPAEWRDEFADRQVPEAIVRLIGSCISSKAEKRPADAGVLAEEIDKIVAPQPPPPPPEPPPESDPPRVAANVLEHDPRWEVVAHPSNGLGFVPKAWLEWLPPLARSGNPRSWISFRLGWDVDRLFCSVEMAPMDDPVKRVEIATKLLDECTSFGFKRSKSRHGVKNNYSRVSTVETILQWSEGGEPKTDAIRTVVKKTLDDLYPKLEKMALVLKPLCQPTTSAAAVPTDRAYWEKRATPETLQLTDNLLKLVNEVEPKALLRYVKHVIGIQVDGLPLHGLGFIPQKACVLLQIKLPQSDEADRQLEEAQLSFSRQGRLYQLRISGAVDDKQREVLKGLIRQAAEADAK